MQHISLRICFILLALSFFLLSPATPKNSSPSKDKKEQVLDSVVIYVQKEGEWIKSYSNSNTYDENNNLILVEKKKLNSDSQKLEMLSRTEIQYDSRHNEIARKVFSWDNDFNSYYVSSKTNSKYDTLNNKLEYTSYNYNKSLRDFIGNRRTTSKFNKRSQEVEKLTYSWDQTTKKWIYNIIEEYRFEEDDLIYWETKIWSKSKNKWDTWTKSNITSNKDHTFYKRVSVSSSGSDCYLRVTTTNTINDSILTIETEYKNIGNCTNISFYNEDKKSKEITIYNSQNKILSTENYKWKWDEEKKDSVWILNRQERNTYDELNRLTQRINKGHIQNSSHPINTKEILIVEYDSNDNSRTFITKKWDNQSKSLILNRKTKKRFNENDKLLEYISYPINSQNGGEKKVYYYSDL